MTILASRDGPRTVAVALTSLALALAGCTSASSGGAASPTPAPASPAPSASATATPVPSAASVAPSASPSAQWPLPADAPLPEATAAKLQTMLEGWVGTSGIPGLAAAVITPEGTWTGAAGEDAAGTKIRSDSAFGIGSTTKTFVAAEILKLAAEGKVDLDAPVTDYVDLPFDTSGATIRQLATMKSGFPAVDDGVQADRIAKDLQHVWTSQEMLELDKGAPRIGTLGGPGKYNGYNYHVLGLVIEKVTGKPLAAALRDDLLAPAGLERIWMQPDEKPMAPLTVAVDDEAVPIVDAKSGYLPSLAAASSGRGGAGMAADAPTLARWTYLLYGGRIIDPSLVAVMTDGDPESDNGYGFGTMTADMDGTFFVGHAGDFMRYSAILLAWPSTQTAVVVLAPKQGAAIDGTLPDWAIRLYQALSKG
jgi:D-alanyl-D-alanine carboxypeptidase